MKKSLPLYYSYHLHKLKTTSYCFLLLCTSSDLGIVYVICLVVLVRFILTRGRTILKRKGHNSNYQNGILFERTNDFQVASLSQSDYIQDFNKITGHVGLQDITALWPGLALPRNLLHFKINNFYPYINWLR